MKIIDLTQQVYDGMPVYPGDPQVHITPVFTVEKDEWAVSRIEMVTHDSTHVNVPRHIDVSGKTLSDYELTDFIAETKVYQSESDIELGKGVLFVEAEINMELAKVIAEKKPAFVGLSEKFDFNLEAERYLLEKGIISYEKLAHCELLPTNESFMFYGIPMNIKDADGAPVRAFAVLK
jgi:arylformamidase